MKKKMKEKWEENDEGRSKLAIKSRLKFRVFAKNIRHQKLDENELKILNEERKRRTANEIDHVASMEEPEGKGNKKKGKKNEGNNKDKDKGKNVPMNKNKINLLNSEDEENMSGSNLFNKNLVNFINKKSRPLSMANIFKHKKPVNKDSKSTFILNFIPNIGPLIATASPLPVLFLQYGFDWQMVLVLLALTAVHFVVGNILETRWLGKGMNLDPIVVVASLIFWALVWGVMGALLAVPLTAIIKMILEQHETTQPLARFLGGGYSFK